MKYVSRHKLNVENEISKKQHLNDLHKLFMNGCRRYLHFEPKYKHEHFPTLTAFFSSRHPELTINMLVYNGLIRQ